MARTPRVRPPSLLAGLSLRAPRVPPLPSPEAPSLLAGLAPPNGPGAPRPAPPSSSAPGARPAAARRPAGGDPYAPQTDAQIAATVKAQIAAQTEPYIKQLTDAINARAAQAQQAINGYTAQFGPALQQLAGVGTAGLATAQQSQAATDAALAQALTNGGLQGARELGAKLDAINAPNSGQLSSGAAQEGAGAGNAALNSGSAALSAINAELAGARDTATKQPGIAALFGGQATRDLQAQALQDTAAQTGQVTSQIPGLVSSLTQAAKDRQQSQLNSNRSYDLNAAKLGATPTKTIGSAQTGFFQYDPRTGGWQRVVGAAAKKGAAARPFTIRPGDTVEVPDGKGGYTAYSAPAAPGAAKAPKTISTPAGTMQWDPKADAWKTIPGTEKPAKQPTATDAKSGLAALATSGGVDWKTGALTPTFRKAARDYITRTTGTDPGAIPPTATPEQLTRLQKELGITPPAAKTPPRPRAPKITGTSPTSKYVITYNPDGSKSQVPNPNYVPPTAKDAGKSKTAAVKAANQTALRIVQGGAKKTGVYTSQPKTDAFGGVVKGPDGKPVMARTRTGDRYSASYYETIHRIENAVEDVLSPYMPRSEIIRFAQRYANDYYPAGSGDRPRTAAQAEKAAPAPKARFPKTGSAPARKPRVPNPRKQFQAEFPPPLTVAG